MPKPRKSAEEVCIELSLAAEAVRQQTRIMRANRCTIADRPSERSFTEGSMTPCTNDVGLEEEEWCDACHVRNKAVKDRQASRKHLGAAKRSVEAVGKRLQKEGAL